MVATVRSEFTTDELAISPFDYIPAAQHAAILAYTSTYDASDDLQRAINDQVYGSGRATAVRLPAGLYNTTKPLHLGYGSTGSLAVPVSRSARLISDGYGLRGELQFRGPVIKCSHSDGPGINIQGARNSLIRGIAIRGAAYAWLLASDRGALAGSSVDDTLGTAWVAPGLDARADTQYATYAGITIDAYSGTRPGTSYADVTYPVAIFGTDSQYGKSASSDVTIENCYVGGFVTCIAVKPSNTDGNADYTKIKRCHLEYARYLISVGHTQSRLVHIEDTNGIFFHTALTNKAHGIQAGRYGGPVTNCQFGGGIQILDFAAMSIGGPLTFNSCYAEQMWKIGNVTPSTSSEQSLHFNQCHFDFGSQNDVRGVPAKLLGTNNNSLDLQFNGGTISGHQSVVQIDHIGVTFNGTLVQPANTPSATYEMIANNALMGGVVLPRLGQAQLRGRFRTKYRIYNRDTGAALSNATITSPVIDNDRRQTIPIYIERVCESQVIGQYGVPVPACVTALGWSAATVTLVEKLLTITYSARTDAEFAYYGPLPGDVILDGATGSVFFVKSRSALVVEAILQNNYVSDGAGGYDPITALTFASGTYYIANSRFYTPGYYLRADITSGSAVAANAGNDAGTSFITDASFGVAVDDYYHADPNSDAIFTPTNAKVASRTSSSITFTGNATRTEPVRKRLGIFIRQPPANV